MASLKTGVRCYSRRGLDSVLSRIHTVRTASASTIRCVDFAIYNILLSIFRLYHGRERLADYQSAELIREHRPGVELKTQCEKESSLRRMLFCNPSGMTA